MKKERHTNYFGSCSLPLSAENLGLDHLRVKIRRLVDSTGTDHHRNLPGVRTVRPIAPRESPEDAIFSRDTASSNNACVEEDAVRVFAHRSMAYFSR